ECLLLELKENTYLSSSFPQWEQRALDSNWRRAVSYLVRKFFFPHREEACARKKAELEEQLQINTFIVAVSKGFNPYDVLKPDSFNLRQWERMLHLHASESFGDVNFFAPDVNATGTILLRSTFNASTTFWPVSTPIRAPNPHDALFSNAFPPQC
ncbi:uncharacterized protein VP01_4435g1, partial [Puccinia sorghi]